MQASQHWFCTALWFRWSILSLTYKVSTTMLSRVAGGASSVLPAHRRQGAGGHTLPAAASAASVSVYRHCRTTPLCLTAVHAAKHASSEARHGELLSRGRHGPPHLYPICVRRTRTMISSCIGKQPLALLVWTFFFCRVLCCV
jgi:hypothetical protein